MIAVTIASQDTPSFIETQPECPRQ